MSDSGKKRPRRLGKKNRLTEDEVLLKAAVEHLEELSTAEVKSESWRVFRIMGEFVEGIDELNHLGPAVTIFGSARTPLKIRSTRNASKPHGCWVRQVFPLLPEAGRE